LAERSEGESQGRGPNGCAELVVCRLNSGGSVGLLDAGDHCCPVEGVPCNGRRWSRWRVLRRCLIGWWCRRRRCCWRLMVCRTRRLLGSVRRRLTRCGGGVVSSRPVASGRWVRSLRVGAVSQLLPRTRSKRLSVTRCTRFPMMSRRVGRLGRWLIVMVLVRTLWRGSGVVGSCGRGWLRRSSCRTTRTSRPNSSMLLVCT